MNLFERRRGRRQLDLLWLKVPLGPKLALPHALVGLPVHQDEVLLLVFRHDIAQGILAHGNAPSQVP